VGVEIDLSPIPSVSLSIECIIWSGYHQRERGCFGGKCAPSHCNQGDLLRSYAKVHNRWSYRLGWHVRSAQALVY